MTVKSPRRRPIPQREREICERLQAARLLLRKTQDEFAKEIGIQRQRLATYEEKRVALRYDLALRICRQHLISEHWIATGKGSWRDYLDISNEAVVTSVPLDMPYGVAYDKYLRPVYEQTAKHLSDSGQKLFRVHLKDGENLSFVLNLFTYLLDDWCVTIKDGDNLRKFLEQMIEHGNVQVADYRDTGVIPDMVRVGSLPAPSESPSVPAKKRS